MKKKEKPKRVVIDFDYEIERDGDYLVIIVKVFLAGNEIRHRIRIDPRNKSR